MVAHYREGDQVNGILVDFLLNRAPICQRNVASQVIRLVGNIYSQTMRIYICGGRPLSYLC